MADRYAVVLLAAGYSRRMEGFKPLLTLGRETIADHLIEVYAQHQISVHLVTGWRQDELLKGIQTRPSRTVFNPAFPQGMFTSIQAGLRALTSGYAAVFVQPVDIPLVRAFTLRRLLAAAAEQPAKIIYPVFQGRRGHPPLIPLGLVPGILAWQEPGGLKSFLAARESETANVPVPDANILFDIDTPADYQTLLERWQNYQIPSATECDVILKDICPVPPAIDRHCRKVAEVADMIGQALSRAGAQPDLAVIHAAAALHDIARTQPGHAVAGAQMLQDMGFNGIAGAVALHTDLPVGRPEATLAAKVVFLADKYVKDAAIVTLEERYSSSIELFGAEPAVLSRIEKRRQRAWRVRDEIAQILGYPLEKVIHP
jgi:molybdenum cofactor cytidylyltransferase